LASRKIIASSFLFYPLSQAFVHKESSTSFCTLKDFLVKLLNKGINYTKTMKEVQKG